MADNKQKKHSATARYNDALARLNEEKRRFDTRQKIILGGALVALRRANGEQGAKILRELIPHIADDDRATVADLIEVRERLPVGPSQKELRHERRRDAVNVKVAEMLARKQQGRPFGNASEDDDGDDGELELNRRGSTAGEMEPD